jgi:pimeloyl-ACP methyl ester carboxylesterase
MVRARVPIKRSREEFPVLISLLRVLLFLVVAYTALLFFLQRSLVFPGAGREVPPPDRSPPESGKQVWLTTSFGEVEAWLFTANTAEPAPALIFAHGNAEYIDDWGHEMEEVPDMGSSVLLVEFPGYGLSQGKPSRKSIRETFQAAFDRLAKEPGVDGSRIVAWGRSLGGGAAGDLATDRPLAALILQSTFVSTSRMAWEAFRAPGFLARDQWDTRKAVEGFRGPILLMHGRTDEVIPFAHAETLAGLVEGLEVTELPCGHNDCLPVWPRILGIVEGFLRENGIL